MSDLSISTAGPSQAAAAPSAGGAPLKLPVDPQSPVFAEVALKVLTDDKPNASKLIGAFSNKTGIGFMLDGKSGRLKELSNVVVGSDQISCNVTIGEYSAFSRGFVPNGQSLTLPVAIRGETLAKLLAALETAPQLQSAKPIVFG
jgi:hypothetical protein